MHQSRNNRPMVVNSYQDISLEQQPVICLGNFDGVHLGHQRVIEECISEAKRQHSPSIVFSFNPHPSEVLGNRLIKPITSYDERVGLLSLHEVNFILMQKFDLSFSKLTANYFVEEILVKHLKARSIVVGRQFHFGHKALGNVSTLKSDGRFNIIECDSLDLDGESISSSAIRKALEVKNLNWAEKALGYPYFASGKVKTGDQRGRSIGFPTANIELTKKLILPDAVYACVVWDCESMQAFSGMANWGSRPTFKNSDSELEVFLFDFKDDLYDRKLRIFFFDFIRDQKKFSGIEELRVQLHSDMQKVQSILANRNIYHSPQKDEMWSLSKADNKLQWFRAFNICKF